MYQTAVRTLSTIALAALAWGASAAPALASPFSYQFASTIAASASILPAGLSVGDSAVITVVLGNGGTSTISQTWTAANLQSVTFNFNNGGLLTTLSSPFSGGLFSASGNFVTNGTGALTSVMTNWGDITITTDYTTNGATPVFWFVNGLNNVYSDIAGHAVNINNVGDMLTAANWRLAPAAVPEPSSLLLLGAGSLGLGALIRRRRA